MTSERVPSWAGLLDLIDDDAAVAPLIAAARAVLDTPIVERVYRLEDVGVKGRTWLDGRTAYSDPDMKEHFAFAMSDMRNAATAGAEMTLLAAAFRLTRDEAFAARSLAQLEEMSTWSPIQRPGWTCFAPDGRLPADGKDGNWLATGVGIRGIVDCIEIMPDGTVPQKLLDVITELLAAEIESVVDDWRVKRPWFVRADNPYTNQWVLPTEGLLRACIYLGRERHREAFDLARTNMQRAIDCRSSEGSFEEGMAYATGTVSSMMHAAHALAVTGDRGLYDHPFLQNFPSWFVQHFQPGGFLINAFDAFAAARRLSPEGRPERRVDGILSLAAVCTGNTDARWALKRFGGDDPAGVAALAASQLPPPEPGYEPPLFASYERAMRVNWRSSWSEDASGVWVRGGHEHDQHDHQDRGHVNVIFSGRPMLIEAGTPAYHNPRLATHYGPGIGHNVLQIGTADATGNARIDPPPGWQLHQAIAPLTVERLNAAGGDVVVDCSKCYTELDLWLRRVQWSVAQVTVTDEVELADGRNEVCLFRWHLGTRDGVSIEGTRVRWRDATMEFQCDAQLDVQQVKLPDHTLRLRDWDDDSPDDLHACIAVATREKVGSIRITMTVTAE